MPTRPALKMLPGMMPILHSSGVSTPGQLGPMRRERRAVERALHLDHVEHRNALGDGDDQRDAGVDGFEDGVGRERRRHVDGGRVGAGRRLGLGDGVEQRHVGELGVGVLGAALAGRDAADDFRAVGSRLLGVERALAAGDALADHLGRLVDENGHNAACCARERTL